MDVTSGMIFVNSVQSLGRDLVEDDFPWTDIDGSADLSSIWEVYSGENYLKDETPDTLIIGRIPIRLEIERLGFIVRGKPYSKRQANKLIKQAECIRILGKRGKLPCVKRDELKVFVEEMHKQGVEKKKNNLQKAREKRWER